MLELKVNYENGGSEATRFNGTVAEAVDWYVDRIFNLGVVDDDLQKCTSIEFLSGSEYENFGCKWKIDKVYRETDENIKKYDLWNKIRFSAHVLEAPADYNGAREIDAAYVA